MPDPHYRQNITRKSSPWLIFLGILMCYALLVVPTVDRLGIGWDEAVDFEIAQSYLSSKGLLLGTSRDPSQTRLPMFTGALVFALLGTSNLLIARFTTVLIGGVTLLGIFIYGKDRFSPAAGLLAAGILAINPFFLSFARLSFTESDVYVACAFTWLLVTLSHFQEKPSLGWAVLSSILLGLAISSKATTLVIVPVVCAVFVFSQVFPFKTNFSSSPGGLDPVHARYVWFWSGLTVLTMLVGIWISQQLNAGAFPGRLHLLNYGLVCLVWFATLGWVMRYRKSTSSPIALAAFIAGYSLMTFVLFPPEHLANSEIINTLILRADQEISFSPGFVGELAALHTFSILFKSTPVLGVGLLAGFIISLAQWRRRNLTLPLLVAAVYLLTLVILPLGQTFYAIPLLPILSLLAADQWLHLFSKRRKISLALITLGLVWWGVEFKQSYPDYHLNGYQWLGARTFFGRSSIGYRSIVFVPADGVQQSMDWLNVHAKAGQTALLYVEPWHIVRAMAPRPVYQLKNGRTTHLSSKPDYVVIHIGSIIWQGAGNDSPHGSVYRYPFDLDTLQKEYEQVFSVQRAFDLEMASIWRKK